MKALESVIKNYKSNTLDGRDVVRLARFLPRERVHELDLIPDESFTQVDYTRENILKQLEKDVSFGFEKALSRRGLSSNMMADVVRMWNWILEDGLEDFSEYAQYGLPLFKATAVKYGFHNPIGDDIGCEYHYSEGYEESDEK